MAGFAAGFQAFEVTPGTDLQIAHVRYLRAALTAAGATPVACPSLALSPAIFTAAATGWYLLLLNACSNCYCAFHLRVFWFAAAVSALNATIATNTSTTAFSPFSSEAAFYLGAYIFEDVGVSARIRVALCYVAVSWVHHADLDVLCRSQHTREL